MFNISSTMSPWPPPGPGSPAGPDPAGSAAPHAPAGKAPDRIISRDTRKVPILVERSTQFVMLWSGCPMTGPRTGSRLCWRTRCRHCRSCLGTASPGIRAKRCRRTRRSPSRPRPRPLLRPAPHGSRTAGQQDSNENTNGLLCQYLLEAPTCPSTPEAGLQAGLHHRLTTPALRRVIPDAACPSMPPWVDGVARQPAQQRA